MLLLIELVTKGLVEQLEGAGGGKDKGEKKYQISKLGIEAYAI